MSMFPNTCVRIYEKTGLTCKYTLNNFVDDLKIKQVLTSQIGNFRFSLPSKKGADTGYLFNDLVAHDKVYIWAKNGAINPATDTPLMVGRVLSIQGQGSKDGLVKVVSGLDQGEILLRLCGFQKHWTTTSAHDIVDTICDALSLGKGEVDACATAVPLDADAQTYFDILKSVSDHWYGVGTKITKDWWVDNSFNLCWKARPIRTAGVESLAYGRDFINYSLITDGSEIKNKIYLFGKKQEFNPKDPRCYGRTEPSDGDGWTYDDAWMEDKGTVSSTDVNPKVGTNSTKCLSDADGHCEYYYPFMNELAAGRISTDGLHGYSYLEYWYLRHGMPSGFTVQIYAPTQGNRIELDFADPGANDTWKHYIYALGENNIYDADLNPTGEWTGVGSPDLRNLQQIRFIVLDHPTPLQDYDQVDGLKFSFGRWRYTAEDSTSQTDYGVREHVVVDDDLYSDSACERKARTLLYQMKDPVKRLDVQLEGNPNVLCGDRIPITIGSENLSATDFDVVSVEHIITKQNWLMAVSMLDVLEHRFLPPNSFSDVILHEFRRSSDIGRGIRIIAK